MSAKNRKDDSAKHYRDRAVGKAESRGRDARTGVFTTITEARNQPKTRVVGRIPKPGHGDKVSGGGMVRFEGGKAIMSRDVYERLVDRLIGLEDIADARDLAEAIKNAKPEDYMPATLAERIFEGEHPVRVWREHRGLTARALAEKAEIPISYLSEIETGKKPGSVDAYRALAEALDLTIDDLVS